MVVVNNERRMWRRAAGIGVVSAVILPLVLSAGGCTAFSPSFLNIIGGEEATSLAGLDNAPGHVVIQFINEAEIDETLLSWLEGRGLALTDAQKRNLHPRVRFRLTVTFTNGNSMQVEFVSGSKELVQPGFDAQSLPDLNQNDLDNFVVTCDVAAVELEAQSVVEVFVPAEIIEFTRRRTNILGDVATVLELDFTRIPKFEILELDTLDDDGNVLVVRNIDARDTLVPVRNVLCGSVITIVMGGVLSVPFAVTDDPSLIQDDQESSARVGGRYEFRVTVD